MSRDLSATNLAEVNASHLHEVVLVKLEFDTPVYVHTGIGTVTYDGDDYLGVGDFGTISGTRESETLGPRPITLTLSGVESTYIAEALDSGNYGDVVTCFVGYRQDDGTLVDDPWLVWKGHYDYAALSLGGENSVSIICQHDLAVLSQADGGRFSDEDQQQRYSGDIGFRYVADMITRKLLWGGGPVNTGGAGGGSPSPGEPRTRLK